jgi:S1-C subfamily serine protease
MEVLNSNPVLAVHDLDGRRPGIASPLTAGSPLRAGDVLLEVGGTPVTNRTTLFRSLTRRLIGQPTPIMLLRNGRQMSVQITPTAAPLRTGAPGS